MIERVTGEFAGRRDLYFVTGTVIKRDVPNKCVYLREFGDQAVPVVGFNYTVKYYDETPNGTTAVTAGNSQPYKTRVKTVTVDVEIPKVGQTVLVAREMGTRRLPRCLGVLQGKNWIEAEAE
jgi:hypothetical protein